MNLSRRIKEMFLLLAFYTTHRGYFDKDGYWRYEKNVAHIYGSIIDLIMVIIFILLAMVLGMIFQ